jgi:hypothetical protein
MADFGFARLASVSREAGAVTLNWQDVSTPPQDYTVFIHALDGAGKVVAQDDSQPAGQRWPTTSWEPGQSVIDRHSIQIPAGTQKLEVGMYLLATGARVPLANGETAVLLPAT